MEMGSSISILLAFVFRKAVSLKSRSRPYNRSGSKNDSNSQWRVIDCVPLFAKACSLVTVSRTDHSREWAWMHPGIPLPFKIDIETKLVTDTEIRLVEAFQKSQRDLKARVFVPYSGYKTDGVANMMKTIRDFANELP